MKHLERINQQYEDWFCNRTQEEHELAVMAGDFEERYFADLRLIAPSIRRSLLRVQEQGDDGQWYFTEDDPPEISIDNWIFRFRRSRAGWSGSCDYKRRTIFIRPGLSSTQHHAALLHEMIHAYEYQLSGPFCEWLLLDLHRRVARRIAPVRLRRYMNISTHSILYSSTHGLLLLFKSLDLDLRLGWKPGTVFGYGRTDYFK